MRWEGSCSVMWKWGCSYGSGRRSPLPVCRSWYWGLFAGRPTLQEGWARMPSVNPPQEWLSDFLQGQLLGPLEPEVSSEPSVGGICYSCLPGLPFHFFYSLWISLGSLLSQILRHLDGGWPGPLVPSPGQWANSGSLITVIYLGWTHNSNQSNEGFLFACFVFDILG